MPTENEENLPKLFNIMVCFPVHMLVPTEGSLPLVHSSSILLQNMTSYHDKINVCFFLFFFFFNLFLFFFFSFFFFNLFLIYLFLFVLDYCTDNSITNYMVDNATEL